MAAGAVGGSVVVLGSMLFALSDRRPNFTYSTVYAYYHFSGIKQKVDSIRDAKIFYELGRYFLGLRREDAKPTSTKPCCMCVTLRKHTLPGSRVRA